MLVDHAAFLVLVSVAAAVLPGLSRLMRLPSAVVEIVFGVVLGRSLLGLRADGEFFSILADLGFLLLMFQAGMEIDFQGIKQQGPRRTAAHLALFAATLALSALCAWLLGGSLFMALVLSTTSLGLVLPSLKEAGLTRSPFAQNLLLAATLADFLTLLGITYFNVWHQHGLGWPLILPAPLLAGFVLLLWLGRLWAWWHPQAAQRLLMAADPQEQGVRLSLALLFVMVGLSALAGIEPVLGAFLGGTMLSFVFREKEVLETKMSALGFGFLIPIFFINVGMEFDLGNLVKGGQLWFVLVLLVMALAVKLLPAMVFPWQGFSMRRGLQAGMLLSSRLSLIVAAAAIGLEQGYLDATAKDSIVLLALVTCLLGPTLFKLSLKKTPPPQNSRPPAPRPPRAGL